MTPTINFGRMSNIRKLKSYIDGKLDVYKHRNKPQFTTGKVQKVTGTDIFFEDGTIINRTENIQIF